MCQGEQDSRSDERDVCAGYTVDEGGLEQAAVLAVESAVSGLEVRDGASERAVGVVFTTGGEDSATLD